MPPFPDVPDLADHGRVDLPASAWCTTSCRPGALRTSNDWKPRLGLPASACSNC
jgi:hypothetical protein